MHVGRLALIAAALTGFLLASAGSHAAATFVPRSGDEVLARLSTPMDSSAQMSAIRDLRRQWQASPLDPNRAAQLAWAYLGMGQRVANARYYGYAQAVLGPWWDSQELSADLRMARAVLLEHDHRFQAARDDLAIVLRRQPRNAQAWLRYANLLQILGEPKAALQSCTALARLRTGLRAQGCVATTMGLIGKDAQAALILERALTESRGDSPQLRRWAYAALARIESRRGRTARAAAHYASALALGSAADHVLGDYIQLLLQDQRIDDALELLRRDDLSDSLKLLKARALDVRDAGAAAEIRNEIAQRIAAQRLRGDTPHAGVEIELLLSATRDSTAARDQALHLAQNNFRSARTPADAQLLLRAAAATSKPAAAAPVRDWIAQTGLMDPALERALKALEQ